MPYATPRGRSTGHRAPHIDMRGVKSDKNIETTIGRNIEVDERSGCWLWTLSTTNRGYAQYRPLTGPVHRFVYETLVGEIPDGHHLHHECRVRHCVNPDHLTPMLPADHSRLHADERRAS